jgi:hypothetical protein
VIWWKKFAPRGTSSPLMARFVFDLPVNQMVVEVTFQPARQTVRVRIDVDKSSSYQLSQNEISDDNPCYLIPERHNLWLHR